MAPLATGPGQGLPRCFIAMSGLALTAQFKTAAPIDQRAMLFVCQADSLPPNHDVYLVGNLPSLGAWQPVLQGPLVHGGMTKGSL